MSCRRLIVISSIALIALVGGACGSSEPSGRASTPKLQLAATATNGAPAADRADAAIYPARPTKYVLDGTLADLGASAVVLRLEAHAVTEADVRRFADALGVTGSPVRTAGGWEVQAADATLTVTTSDGAARITYSRGVPTSVDGSTGSGSSGSGSSDSAGATKPEPAPRTPTTFATPPTPPTPPAPPAPPVDVPSAADAQSIAQTLLDRMGVLAGQKWSIAVSDSGDVAVACAVGVPCPSVPPDARSRTVTFTLAIDGKPVDGVNWSVMIGEHRRIESLYGEWSSPVAVGSYPLRSTTDVFADLQNGTARYPGVQAMAVDVGNAEPSIATVAPVPIAPPSETRPPETPSSVTPAAVTVRVTGVSLGIASWSAVDGRANVVDLVPTYNFHVAADGATTYDIAVLALEPSAVTFVNPVPTPEPLPAEAKE